MLEDSPIRGLSSWRQDAWRADKMMFLRADDDGIETAEVFRLGIMYETEFFSDRVLSDIESGLLILGIWQHNGRPRRTPAEITDIDGQSVLATDAVPPANLMLVPRMSVWLPEEDQNRVFLVKPERFRVWEISTYADTCYWHPPRTGILYGAAATSDAIVEIVQEGVTRA